MNHGLNYICQDIKSIDMLRQISEFIPELAEKCGVQLDIIFNEPCITGDTEDVYDFVEQLRDFISNLTKEDKGETSTDGAAK